MGGRQGGHHEGPHHFGGPRRPTAAARPKASGARRWRRDARRHKGGRLWDKNGGKGAGCDGQTRAPIGSAPDDQAPTPSFIKPPLRRPSGSGAVSGGSGRRLTEPTQPQEAPTDPHRNCPCVCIPLNVPAAFNGKGTSDPPTPILLKGKAGRLCPAPVRSAPVRVLGKWQANKTIDLTIDLTTDRPRISNRSEGGPCLVYCDGEQVSLVCDFEVFNEFFHKGHQLIEGKCCRCCP